jgi:hypothetical protein
LTAEHADEFADAMARYFDAEGLVYVTDLIEVPRSGLA